MAKKILYITYDGLTDPLGQSQVLPYLFALSKNGVSFHVLSFEKKENYKALKDEIHAFIKDSSIAWHPQVYHRHPPVVSTMFDLWWMKRHAKKLHRKHSFDGTWCRSYIPAMVGTELKRKFQLPFIFDMRGFWPDERVEGGSWPLANPVFKAVYNYFKKREKELLIQAGHVVVLTNKASELLNSGSLRNNPIPKRISVIPCCVDLDLFDPSKITESQKNAARMLLGIEPTDSVLVYAGSLGTWYMVKEMLQYFSQLKNEERDWKFLFLTKDSPRSLLAEARSMGFGESDLIVRSCIRSEMPVYLSLAKIAISFIQPVFSKQASSPTKLAEYMAMGLKVVCNIGVGDVDEIIVQSGAGRLVNDEGDIVFLGESDSQKIRKYAEDTFSLELGVEIYKEISTNIFFRKLQ